MGGAETSKRRSREPGPGRLRVPKLRGGEAAPAPADLDALLVAHCRMAVTELPAGRPGARWAADFLEALPEACRRRLPDVVATGPKLFEFLVGQGLFAAMPSPRIVPLVLGLVASASPLLQARSSRQWVLWLARVRDPGSPIAAEIQARTPTSQLAVTVPAPPVGPPRRAGALLAERDRLQLALEAEVSTNERLRAELGVLLVERDRLAADLEAATHAGEARHAELAADHEATLSALQGERDRMRMVVALAQLEREALQRQLSTASEASEGHASERDRLAEALRAEKAEAERLRTAVTLAAKGVTALRASSAQQSQRLEQRINDLELQMKKFAAYRQRAMEISAEIRRALEADPDDPRNDALLVAEMASACRRARAEVQTLQRENAALRAEAEKSRAR